MNQRMFLDAQNQMEQAHAMRGAVEAATTDSERDQLEEQYEQAFHAASAAIVEAAAAEEDE